MPNPERKYDKSHLSIDQAELRGFIHRDYIAHCFRWSYVVKFLMQKHRYAEEIILDVGCGRDLPLPRLMYTNKMTDFAYVGIDMNVLGIPDVLKTAVKNGKADIQLMPETDASRVTREQLQFEAPTIGVCFEVLEHVHPKICRRLVKNIYDLVEEGANVFFSTPVYNGSAAANHINEMELYTVGMLLEDVGFRIRDYYGTFASQTEIKDKVEQRWPKLFEALGKYYDSNVLSVIFAPAFPHQSRNVLWHCYKNGESTTSRIGWKTFLPTTPRGQHKDIEELMIDG